jgi:hypothetical protein
VPDIAIGTSVLPPLAPLARPEYLSALWRSFVEPDELGVGISGTLACDGSWSVRHSGKRCQTSSIRTLNYVYGRQLVSGGRCSRCT